MLIAAAILLAMVLYLIDKNQQWLKVWNISTKVSKWFAKAILWLAFWVLLNYFVKDKLASWIILGTIVVMLALWEWGGKRQAAQVPTTPPAGEGQLPPPPAGPSNLTSVP